MDFLHLTTNLSSYRSAILGRKLCFILGKLTILLKTLVQFLAPFFKRSAGKPFFFCPGLRRCISLRVYMLKLTEQLAFGCPRMIFPTNGVWKLKSASRTTLRSNNSTYVCLIQVMFFPKNQTLLHLIRVWSAWRRVFGFSWLLLPDCSPKMFVAFSHYLHKTIKLSDQFSKKVAPDVVNCCK